MRLPHLLILSSVALAACADRIVPPGPAPHVTITGGNEQSGAALDTLALPLEITVVNDAGAPVAGRPVTWASADATGRILPVAETTDAEGRARAMWVLGFEAGAHSASATVAGEEGAAEFTATASPVVGFRAIALMQGSTSGTVEHMCALAVDSLAWCWGGNFVGQLGDGTTEAAGTPRKVVGDRRFASIHGDLFNTCGLAASGELWCWGKNHIGGLQMPGVFGNGTAQSSSVPVHGAPGLLFRDFDLEYELACGVTIDARAYCWGDGDGALGDGGPGFFSGVPAELSGERAWLEVAVSDDFRCALGDDHRAYCWADPDFFPRWPWIGVPEEAGPDNVPLLVEIVGPLTDISVGEFGPCGLSLLGAGTAVCWGIGSTDPPPGPVSISLGSSVRTVVSDGFSRAALDAEGQLWVWPGRCDRGCSSTAGREAPVLLFPGIEWSDISLANGLHAISARDSVVFSLGSITAAVGASSFQLAPVPLP